jgi:hypothetical protein
MKPLPSFEHGWKCQVCYTGNEPDYERCQECGADVDGNPKKQEAEDEATS